ncbi:hypothetical protein BH708_02365 [Brachybacterium sp. P6-10-X1]|uniref:hypothetical protein n=1 Tax=Brachybacterium sp. P6-10-X1 TaxID=1903186 RepID=UPI000971B276|nr:hypothetical protein [Brachybacterium sp. P6-10-X1]APX31752.1 hypothetical protein BH708_02365 [Brachybacterium sp. P6-10-X1]
MTTSPTQARLHRLRTGLASLLSRLENWLLPLAVAGIAATVWLMVIIAVTDATGNAALVLALVALPGAVAVLASRRERRCWHEYALVWLLYLTSVPAYGALLLVGGYTLVAARAWHRHRRAQAETD